MHPDSKTPANATDAPLRSETTGLVLAGGAGRRVQGRDKGLIPWQGEPLVAHAAGSLRPLVCELLISCNRHPDSYARLTDRVVADDRAGYQGPLAGLEAARNLIATPLLLVAPCDMPGVPAAVFERLLKTLTAPQGPRRDAVFLHSGGRDYYLCLALRSHALASLANYLDGGERSVRGWLATLDTKAETVDLPHEQLRNINALPGD